MYTGADLPGGLLANGRTILRRLRPNIDALQRN
jgi:hypothetical protein